MNILLIMEDALRARNLGCYGYPRPTSPNLDRMAREGVRFETCVAVSAHTFPPVVSILTGLFPASHRLMTERDYNEWKHAGIWRGRRLPLHSLAENGWAVDGELVMRWSPLGFTRDCNSVLDYIRAEKGRKWFYFAQPYFTHLPYNPPEEYYLLMVEPGFAPDPETAKRMDVVRRYMVCHPPDVKAAMEVGQEDSIGTIGDGVHDRSSVVVEFQPRDAPGITALYDGEVRVFDDYLGRVLHALEEAGILDDTLVIVTADHGEELLERGHVGHTSCNLKGTLYDECLLVPLVMRYPPKLPPSIVVRQQVSQVDIMPTIFDLMDIPFDFAADGRSLLPLIRGAREFREEAYAETPPAGWQALRGDERRIYCVRTPRWKLIEHVVRPGAPGRHELYDLALDPVEKHNSFNEDRAIAESLVANLHRHLAGVGGNDHSVEPAPRRP